MTSIPPAPYAPPAPAEPAQAPATPHLSSVVIAPSVVGVDPQWLRRRAPELARDIACQLDNPDALAKAAGLTEQQWLVVQQWAAFQQMLREAREELSGSAGTVERARRKAALAIAEVGVQDMATIMGDPRTAPGDRIKAFDQLKDVAVMGSRSQMAAAAVGGASGPVFGGALIQIIMPGGAQLDVGGIEEADPAPKPAIEGESERIA